MKKGANDLTNISATAWFFPFYVFCQTPFFFRERERRKKVLIFNASKTMWLFSTTYLGIHFLQMLLFLPNADRRMLEGQHSQQQVFLENLVTGNFTLLVPHPVGGPALILPQRCLWQVPCAYAMAGHVREEIPTFSPISLPLPAFCEDVYSRWTYLWKGALWNESFISKCKQQIAAKQGRFFLFPR